ncbi:glycosyltransferase [Desulfocapsa sulfexigens DSM 10523]|uniref:Glycosyltransferase n=1 Tax=Desulfocapsa sulfexigens (strain DSM 10523 / SB164P1) TaxID=1167006 RepID=M1PPL5_DESSD|nr:glycosyltransferase [Desulfocapsa sulfexigens]AGF78356.1 glycosyltransferase [Desulfocapsa sulfexigens DSM 10523]
MNKPDSRHKRIFIVGPTESLLTKRGNRHPALALFLVNHGHELEYLTSDFYHAEKRWFSNEEIGEAEDRAPYHLTVMKCLGYQSNISPRRIISNILLSLKFFFYLLPRLNKKTALILPSRPVEMIFAAAILRILKKNTVLLDIQDVWPDMLPPTQRIKKIAFYSYCNLLLYPSLRFINLFIHTAPSFTNWLNRYAPGKKSIFIPLGYDRARWPVDSAMKPLHNGEQIKLVCVAKLQHQIDCSPIVEAIKGDTKFHFSIVGEDGTGDRYQEITQLIEQYKINNVSITGKVAPEEVPTILQRMHIGVVPMISPSIPNKVFDYVASGIPILVLGDFDSSQFVLEHQIGWSCSFNKESVSQLLDSLTVEDIINKSKAVIQIRNSFSRDVLFEKIDDLLK